MVSSHKTLFNRLRIFWLISVKPMGIASCLKEGNNGV